MGKCSANEGKTNRFALFQIRAAFAAIGPRTPLASGMAAREGEDPHAGLQRSRQPGPTGATPSCSLDEPANTKIMGAMYSDYEQHLRNAVWIGCRPPGDGYGAARVGQLCESRRLARTVRVMALEIDCAAKSSNHQPVSGDKACSRRSKTRNSRPT